MGERIFWYGMALLVSPVLGGLVLGVYSVQVDCHGDANASECFQPTLAGMVGAVLAVPLCVAVVVFVELVIRVRAQRQGLRQTET